MYKIALLNPKGGVGKTTIAVNLACSLKLDDYKVLIADSDPQCSSRSWSSRNNGEIVPVIAFDDERTIASDLNSVKASYDYVIIDASSKLDRMLAAIITIADMLIIPFTPSPYDIWALKDLFDIIDQRQKIAGKPDAYILVSRYSPRIKLLKSIQGDMEEILKDYDIKKLDSMIMQRQVYPQSTELGISVFQTENSAAIEEISNLKSEIKRYQYGLLH